MSCMSIANVCTYCTCTCIHVCTCGYCIFHKLQVTCMPYTYCVILQQPMISTFVQLLVTCTLRLIPLATCILKPFWYCC